MNDEEIYQPKVIFQFILKKIKDVDIIQNDLFSIEPNLISLFLQICMIYLCRVVFLSSMKRKVRKTKYHLFKPMLFYFNL
jgi:hypothetical protein